MINSTMFGVLWSLAPTFVSIVSFYAYIYTGHELTISTAFTVSNRPYPDIWLRCVKWGNANLLSSFPNLGHRFVQRMPLDPRDFETKP